MGKRASSCDPRIEGCWLYCASLGSTRRKATGYPRIAFCRQVSPCHHHMRGTCNDIERSLPKGLVESVLDVDFKQGPGLVCRVLLTVESAGRGVSLFCLFALWMASAWPNTALHLVMRLTASSAARFDLADFNTHTSSCKASWTSVSTRCTSRAAKTAFMFVSRSLRPIQISRTLGLDAHLAQDGHLVDLF